MKIATICTALIALSLLTACAEDPVCPVWFVAEEVDTGTAQRVTVAFDEALEGDKRFSFAGAPGDGVVTFVLKRAALADRSREDIRLTYQIAESGHDQVAHKTANCGADGRLCMPSILRELFAQCRLGA